MAIKLTTKIGDVSFDFEGSREEFTELVLPLVEKAWERPLQQAATQGRESVISSNQLGSPPHPQMSVRTIAARLGADSGSDLVIAAAGALSIVKGQDVFGRQELHNEMKQAAGYYKSTYGSNLSSYIDTLLKNGTLLEMGKETYSLGVSSRQIIEQKLI